MPNIAEKFATPEGKGLEDDDNGKTVVSVAIPNRGQKDPPRREEHEEYVGIGEIGRIPDIAFAT